MECERCGTRAVIASAEAEEECLACGHVRGERARRPTADEARAPHVRERPRPARLPPPPPHFLERARALKREPAAIARATDSALVEAPHPEPGSGGRQDTGAPSVNGVLASGVAAAEETPSLPASPPSTP